MGILVGTMMMWLPPMSRNIQHVNDLPFQLFVTHVRDEYLAIGYITFMYWMCFQSFSCVLNPSLQLLTY
jgi:hypothetical protein